MSVTNHQSIWSDLQGVPFEQAYVDAAGVRTRYLRAGHRGKPVVLFLHGTGGHAEAYVRNLAAHAQHFDVIALDLLGHGFTAKPDRPYTMEEYVGHLRAFLDAQGIARCSLSGESLGGWVAAHFALAHRAMVHKLVLNTASGDKVDSEALARIRELSLLAVNDPSWERIRTRLEWLMHRKGMVNDDLVRTRQAIYEQPEMKVAMQNILVLHTPEARRKYAISEQQWAALGAPTLVLWTDHDPTASVQVGQELAGLITGSEFVVMKDCGHWPQYEDADEFNRIHIEFLQD